MPLNGLFTYSPFYSGVLDTRLLSWQWKCKQFYTQRQQRWQARDKRSQSDLKRFLRTTRRAKLDKKRNWVTVYLALFCNLVAAQVPCTIIVRGYGHKQKMEIIKWMFSFFWMELTIGSAVMLEHKTEYKDYLRCRPLSQRRSLAFPGVNYAILAVPCPSLYFRKEQ